MQQRHIDKALFEDNIHEKHLRWRKDAVLPRNCHGITGWPGGHRTAVEPGMFRTDWAGRSMVRSERSIADYDAIFNPIREARKARDGRQPGDPAKAGKAIAEFLTAPEPPLHLLLGPDAFEYVNKELDTLRAEFDAWERVTRSTNFDEAA